MTIRLFVLDPDLQTSVGHSFEASVRVAEAGIAAGMQPFIFGNRHFATGPVSVAGGKAAIIPFFKAHAFDFGDLGKGGVRLNAAFDDEPVMQEWEIYLKKLLELDKRYHFCCSDVIYAHTLSYAVAVGWLYFLLLKEPAERPTIYSLIYAGPASIQGSRAGNANIVEILRKFEADGLLYHNIFFHTETVRLRDFYGALGFKFPMFMGPIPQKMLDSRQSPLKGTTTITYLGEAREEKGFQMVPEIIDDIMSRLLEGERSKVRFIVQISANSGNNTEIIWKARERLVALRDQFNNIELLDDLPASVYQRVLDETDIALLPYDPEIYHTRGSGIAFEALAAGKVVACSPDTDIAVTFEDDPLLVPVKYDAHEFASSIVFYARLTRSRKKVFRRGATNFDGYGVGSFFAELKAAHQAYAKSDEQGTPPAAARKVCLYLPIAQFSGGNGFVQRVHMDALRKLGYFTIVVGIPWFFENHHHFKTNSVPKLMDRYLKGDNEFLNSVVFFPFVRNDSIATGFLDNGISSKHEIFTFPAQSAYFEHVVAANSLLMEVLRRTRPDVCIANYSFTMPLTLRLMNGGAMPLVLETHDFHAIQNRARRAIREGSRFDAQRDAMLHDEDEGAEIAAANRATTLLHISETLREQHSLASHPEHVVVRPYLINGSASLAGNSGEERAAEDIFAFCYRGGSKQVAAAQRHLLHKLNLKSVDLLFYGSAHPSNTASLLEFLNVVFIPHLLQKKMRLFVAGDVCSSLEADEAAADLMRQGALISLGRVNDIDGLIEAARVVVLYVSQGTGFPTRVVEVLGKGQAFTINARALLELEGEARRHFRVCSQAEETAEDIVNLLAAKENRIKRGKDGQEFYRNVFSEKDYLVKFARAIGHKGTIPVCLDVATGHMERTFTNVDPGGLAAFYLPLDLGKIYRFSKTGIPREFLVFDWSKAEDTHTWIDGRKGGVLFHLDPSEGQIEEIELHIGILESLLREEPKVSVVLNEQLLGVLDISTIYCTLNVRVPREMRSETGLYQLEIECDQKGKAPGDMRDLSISVSEFVCYGSKPERNIAAVPAIGEPVAELEDLVDAAVLPQAEQVEAPDLPLWARFSWDSELDHSGFYQQETDREGNQLRWIGPDPRAVVTMPRVQLPAEIRIYVVNVFNWDIMSQVQIAVDGGPPVTAKVEMEGERRVLVAVIAGDGASRAKEMRVEIDTIETRAPSGLENAEQRRFSLAIGSVEARSLCGGASDASAVVVA